MPLIRSDRLPNIGIEVIDPNAPQEVLADRAERISNFMGREVQLGFYMGELGLKWIDEEDEPSSPDNPGEIEWRIGRLRASGPDVERSGLQFILAHSLDENGELSADNKTLAGIAVFKKPEGLLCTPGEHTPTELLELTVAQKYRRRLGLGPVMLRHGVAGVHPDDPFILYVAEQNTNAQQMYEQRYGLRYNGKRKTEGTFATADGTKIDHIGMEIPTHELQQRLDVVYAPPETS